METKTQPQESTAPVAAARIEHCRGCAATVTSGQRYCLECGEPTPAAIERLELLDRVGRPVDAERTATTPPPADGTALQGTAQRAPHIQRLIDEQNQHPSPESRYAVFGAAGATAILVTALAAGAIGAGLANNGSVQQPTVVQAAAAQPTATPAAQTTFASDWPAGTDGWTVVLAEIDKSSSDAIGQAGAAKTAAAGKGLDAGALDSDDFSSLNPGKYVVYAGQLDNKKAATKALKDAKAKGYPAARVAEVSAGAAADTGAKSKATLDDDALKNLDNLTPEERLKLPDETTTQGKPPPTDDEEAGGGSDEVTIGSLGTFFGVKDGEEAGDVVGFDVNSLTTLNCIWPSQTGLWTVGRALRLAPGTPVGWRFDSPVNDFFSGGPKAPGVTFCQISEHSQSAALAFRGRYTTAAAARKAAKRDPELKAIGGHVLKISPMAPYDPGATGATGITP
ncbi:MAG: hypothetical protein WAP35_04195 [Solirubrobacterales bacterium]